MGEGLKVSPCAFQVSDANMDEIPGPGAGSLTQFTYTRCARRSVMLMLGFAPNSAGSNETIDVYAKVPENTSVQLMMSFVCGVAGTLKLSKCVAECGALLGAGCLIGLTAATSFLCHRMVEIPSFVGQNLETFTEVVKTCCPIKPVWLPLSIMVITSFYCQILLALREVYFDIHFVFDNHIHNARLFQIFWVIVMCLPFVPTAFFKKPSDLHKAATWGLWSMGAASTIEIVCALHHGLTCVVTHCEPLTQRITFWPQNFQSVLKGASGMLCAYTAAPCVPYIVASMLEPRTAKRMVKTANNRIGIFYFIVGMTCYFGWGKSLATAEEPTTPFQAMWEKGYQMPALFMACGLVVRAWTTSALAFWVISRELDTFLPHDTAPPVALGLPWAIRRAKYKKKALQFTALSLTFLPLVVIPTQGFSSLSRVLNKLSINMTSAVLPACLAVVAIQKHGATINAIVEAGAWRASAYMDQPYEYVGGSIHNHFLVALCIAVLMCVLYVVTIVFYILDMTAPSS